MNALRAPARAAYTVQTLADGTHLVLAHPVGASPPRVAATVPSGPDAPADAARFARSAELQALLAEWSFDGDAPGAATLIRRTHACLARLDGESAPGSASEALIPPAPSAVTTAPHGDPMAAFGQLLTEAERQIARMYAAAGPHERQCLNAMTLALELMFPALDDAISLDCRDARWAEGLS